MAAVEGDERVIATAQQIVRSLATTETMTKDMLRILSNFDNRFSSMTERLGTDTVSDIEERLASAEEVVLRWDGNSSEAARESMIWEGPPDEAASYLQAVDEVQRLTESLESISLTENDNDESNNNDFHGSELLDRAQNVLQIAMARLEEEFQNILVQQGEIFEPERLYQMIHGPVSRVSFCSSRHEDMPDVASISSGEGEGDRDEDAQNLLGNTDNSGDLIIDLIRPEVIPDLKDIAERMVASKYERECCQVYSTVRREILDEGLRRLGIEKLSIEEIQKMDWETLEGKIKKWNQAVKIAVQVLLGSEKRLCVQIFEQLGSIQDTCFVETAKGAIMQLLNFAEAIAISRRSPERLFRILDMYESLSDLLPAIKSIFSDESCACIRAEADGILTRLGEAAKGTFVEFENAIQRDTSKTPIPGGAIHPLTRYVMNYIKFLFDYTDILKQLIDEKKEAIPRQLSDGFIEFAEEDHQGDLSNPTPNSTPLARRLLSITSLLESNLEGKSKLYKDIALSHLFMMNNIRYIVQKVKGSELRTLLGDDWIRRRSGQVRQYATNYQRSAWRKVLSCLRDEGIYIGGSSSSKVSKEALKDRFKSFNAMFEEVYRNQTAWFVPDPQLRVELRISIEEKLLPAYRAFLGRFRMHLEGVRHAERYIKYSAEDLENFILDLFEGSPGSMNNQRRRTGS